MTWFLQKSIVMNFQLSSWIKQPLFVEKWVSGEGNYFMLWCHSWQCHFASKRLRGIYWRLSIASLWIDLGFKRGEKWFVFLATSNMKVNMYNLCFDEVLEMRWSRRSNRSTTRRTITHIRPVPQISRVCSCPTDGRGVSVRQTFSLRSISSISRPGSCSM